MLAMAQLVPYCCTSFNIDPHLRRFHDTFGLQSLPPLLHRLLSAVMVLAISGNFFGRYGGRASCIDWAGEATTLDAALPL